MEVPSATKSMILDDLKRPGACVVTISRRYGVPAQIIRTFSTEPTGNSSFSERYAGYGRPDLQQYIISRKQAGYDWPVRDQDRIQAARVSYDAGNEELCQGRDGNWIILYCIPRVCPDTMRSPYFSAEVEE